MTVDNESDLVGFLSRSYATNAWTVYRLARAAMRNGRFALGERLLTAIDDNVIGGCVAF